VCCGFQSRNIKNSSKQKKIKMQKEVRFVAPISVTVCFRSCEAKTLYQNPRCCYCANASQTKCAIKTRCHQQHKATGDLSLTFRSRRAISDQPSFAKWYNTLQPTTPPPITTALYCGRRVAVVWEVASFCAATVVVSLQDRRPGMRRCASVN
jgi:hypothetical protein